MIGTKLLRIDRISAAKGNFLKTFVLVKFSLAAHEAD